MNGFVLVDMTCGASLLHMMMAPQFGLEGMSSSSDEKTSASSFAALSFSIILNSCSMGGGEAEGDEDAFSLMVPSLETSIRNLANEEAEADEGAYGECGLRRRVNISPITKFEAAPNVSLAFFLDSATPLLCVVSSPNECCPIATHIAEGVLQMFISEGLAMDYFTSVRRNGNTAKKASAYRKALSSKIRELYAQVITAELELQCNTKFFNWAVGNEASTAGAVRSSSITTPTSGSGTVPTLSVSSWRVTVLIPKTSQGSSSSILSSPLCQDDFLVAHYSKSFHRGAGVGSSRMQYAAGSGADDEASSHEGEAGGASVHRNSTTSVKRKIAAKKRRKTNDNMIGSASRSCGNSGNNLPKGEVAVAQTLTPSNKVTAPLPLGGGGIAADNGEEEVIDVSVQSRRDDAQILFDCLSLLQPAYKQRVGLARATSNNKATLGFADETLKEKRCPSLSEEPLRMTMSSPLCHQVALVTGECAFLLSLTPSISAPASPTATLGMNTPFVVSPASAATGNILQAQLVAHSSWFETVCLDLWNEAFVFARDNKLPQTFL